MKIKSVHANRLPILRRLALATLVLLVACGHSGGAIEEVASRSQPIVTPGTPPPPATLGWPVPAVIGSEVTGTLPGEGSVGAAGEYRYTLPIEVPPGRAGMAPSLSLSYSSSGENGIAGVGWSLSGLSSIKKCSKTIATDGAALEDAAMCLDGQRLVATGKEASAYPGDTSTVDVYRTESDSFARIESLHVEWDGGVWVSYDSFRVFLKNGRIFTYIPNPGSLFMHLLAREEDRFGNTVRYQYVASYSADPSGGTKKTPIFPGVASTWPDDGLNEATLLDQITYTGRMANGDQGSRWVKVNYKDRADAIVVGDPRGGLQGATSTKLIASIDCYAPAPAQGTGIAAPSLAWSYGLTYAPSPDSGHSRLLSIKRTGTLSSGQFAKVFDWTSTKGGFYQSPNQALPQADTAGNFLVLDVDHDGRDELLYSPPGPVSAGLMYSTAGAGSPLAQVTTLPGLSNATFTDAGVGDIDGDGIPEIVAPDRNANTAGVKAYVVYKWSPSTHTYAVGTQANPPWKSYIDPLLSKNSEQPIFLVDMDGDGLPDMIQAQYSLGPLVPDATCIAATTPERTKCLWYDWLYFHNDGGVFGSAQLMTTSNSSVLKPPRSGSPFSATVLTDRGGRNALGPSTAYVMPAGNTFLETFQIAANDTIPSEVNGLIPDAGCVRGNFSGRGNEEICDALPAGWRSTVFDLDGDGRDEIFQYWPNTTNGTFAAVAGKHIFWGLAGTRQEDYLSQIPLLTGDFNGDGFQDAVLWDQALGKTIAALSTAPTRDLMVAVRDETAAKPMETVQYSQRWSAVPVTATPCPPHPERCIRQGMNVVVERDLYQGSDVDVYEHNFYNYEDPRVDVHGRGFLGFATVRAWNPDRLSETISEYDNTASVNGVYFAFMPSRVSRFTAITTVANGEREFQVRGSVVNSQYAIDRTTPVTYSRHPTTWDSAEWETYATIDMTVGAAKHFIFSAYYPPPPLVQRTGEASFDEYGNQVYSRFETVGGVKTEVKSTYDNFPSNWLIGELTQTLTSVTGPGNGTLQPRQTVYTYGSKGELASVDSEGGYTNPDPEIGYTATFEYNADGMAIKATGRAAKESVRNVYTDYDPDEGIFPRKIWNDLGHTSRVLYHPTFGSVSTEISANGVESQVVFDGLGRTRKVSRDGENPVSIKPSPRKNAAGNLTGSCTDTSGAGIVSTHGEYDEYGRPVLQSHVGFDGASVFSQTKYDGLGRVLFTSRSGVGQPDVTGTTFAYDGLGRVLSITPPSAPPTTSAHTFFRTTTTDAVGHTSYAVGDLDGRTVETGDIDDGGNNIFVSFQYGNFNQLKAVTDSQSNTSRIYYDQRGRRASLSDPDVGASTFHYNGFSELTELDSPGINGSTTPAQTFYKHDSIGRIVHVDNGDGATVFTWDTSAYGVGLLASQTSPWATQSFEYDWYGRPAKETWTVGKESFDMLTSYDGSGRVSTISYPQVPGRARFTVQRNYSPTTSYFTSVAEIDLATPHTLWEVQSRNAAGQLLQGQFGNGRLSKRVYEPTTSRLKSITDMACTGVNCVGAEYSVGYTYLVDGNVDTRTDYVVGRAEKFKYDALNRLTEWQLTYSGTTRTTDYKYDNIGNLDAVQVNGATTESNTYFPGGGLPCSGGLGAACPGPHAIASSTVGGVTQKFDYDTRGRQIGTAGRKVAFSEANLPTSIKTSAGLTAFSYDAAGSRVKKAGPDGDETVSLGGLYERRTTKSGIQHVFFVSGGEGNMTQVSFTEGTPNSDRIEYLHTDALGSTGAVTDDTGAISRLYNEPFGARVNANGAAFSGTLGDVRLGFTGHVHDDELALVDMKGRIYDPSQRRFISPDPLVSSPASPQSYNRYSYVWNNPLHYTDPSGFGNDSQAPASPPKTTDSGGNHTTGGGPGNPDGVGGNWTAYHTDGGATPVPATPFKGAPAQAGSAGASAIHAAGVHADRKVMADLDDPGPGILAQIFRAMGNAEPGAHAARAGIIAADWIRNPDVPPDGPEMKALMSGGAHMVMQAKPLLAPAPAPPAPAPELVAPVATTPPVVTGGSSTDGTRLPQLTHDNAHGFTIRDVNPTGNDLNCAQCSVAVDDLLAGREPWAAPAADRTTHYNELERAFGNGFSDPQHLKDVLSDMNGAGPGARGIIFAIPDPQSGRDGHFFNVANQGGAVRLLDGQTGTAADPSPFERFRLLRTNP